MFTSIVGNTTLRVCKGHCVSTTLVTLGIIEDLVVLVCLEQWTGRVYCSCYLIQHAIVDSELFPMLDEFYHITRLWCTFTFGRSLVSLNMVNCFTLTTILLLQAEQFTLRWSGLPSEAKGYLALSQSFDSHPRAVRIKESGYFWWSEGTLREGEVASTY